MLIIIILNSGHWVVGTWASLFFVFFFIDLCIAEMASGRILQTEMGVEEIIVMDAPFCVVVVLIIISTMYLCITWWCYT